MERVLNEPGAPRVEQGEPAKEAPRAGTTLQEEIQARCCPRTQMRNKFQGEVSDRLVKERRCVHCGQMLPDLSTRSGPILHSHQPAGRGSFPHSPASRLCSQHVCQSQRREMGLRVVFTCNSLIESETEHLLRHSRPTCVFLASFFPPDSLFQIPGQAGF